MAITVNGAVLRNMPEQISKNVEDIADLQTASTDHESRISDLENDIISSITFNNMSTTGNTVLGDAAGDSTTIHGTLQHTDGNAEFGGNVEIDGTLTVNSATDLNNDLDVAGDASVSGALSATGNASVGGNLTVTGDITANGNIVNTLLNNTENVLRGSNSVASYYANEGDITIENLPEHIGCNYAHWRISNGKLSIVLALYILSNNSVDTTIVASEIGRFSIPQWAWDSLIGFEGAVNTPLDNKRIILCSLFDTSGSHDITFWLRIAKPAQNVISLQMSTVTVASWSGGNRSGRAEFNFTI